MSIYDSIRQEQSERYSTGGVDMSYYERFANMDYDRFMSGGLTYGKSEEEEKKDPWELQIVSGRHLDGTEDLTADNYIKFAANQIEYLEERSGTRMGNHARERFIDLWRQAATGDNSRFAVDYFKRARAKKNENPWVSYQAGVMSSLGGTAEGVVGIFSPEMAQRMQEKREAHFGSGGQEGASKWAGLLGQGIGTAGQILAGGELAGMAGMVGQAAVPSVGRSRMLTAVQRARGEDISRGSEWGHAVSEGILQGVAGYVSAGIAGRMGRVFGGRSAANSFAQAYRMGGERGAAGFASKTMRTIPGMLQEAGEEGITEIASNALAKAWGIDDDRSLYEGATEAAIMGGLISPFVGAGFAHQAQTRLSKSIDQGEPPVPGTYPADGELDHSIPQPLLVRDDGTHKKWSNMEAWDETPGPWTNDPNAVKFGEMRVSAEDKHGVLEEATLGDESQRVTKGKTTTGGVGPVEGGVAFVDQWNEENANSFVGVDREMPGAHPRPGWSISPWLEDFVTPISHRIELISRPIAGRLLRFEAMTRVEQQKHLKVHDQFFTLQKKVFKKAPQNTKELFRRFENEASNGNFKEAEAILRGAAPDAKTGDALVENMNELRRSFAAIRAEAVQAGVPVGEIEEYWPRSVRDHKQYRRVVAGEEKNVLEEAFRRAAEKGKKLSDADKDAITNRVLQNYVPQGYSRGQGSIHTKQRRVKQVRLQDQGLYKPSAQSSYDYITRMVEAGQAAKFFGRNKPLAAERATLDAAIDFDMESSVGEFVRGMYERGSINGEQVEELTHLLNARFVGGMRSPHRHMRTIRDLGYMTTLANPLSALVQLGDIALSAIENGVMRGVQSTGRVAGKWVAGKLGKDWDSIRTVRDAAIHDIAAEFMDASAIAKTLRWAFKWSGFATIDSLGKSVMVDSSWTRFQSIARMDPNSRAYQAFKAEWGPVFGTEVDSVLADLRAGVVSDNVKVLLFSQVSKTQPISLSEMPVKYLENPNGRLFYMLKTFTLKQLNFMRRTSADKMATGNWQEGFEELFRFAMIFGMAGMSVDAMKRWLVGQPLEEEDVPDLVVENIYRVFGGSKYLAGKVHTGGPGKAFFGLIIPPTNILDDPYKDAAKLPDIMKGDKDWDEIKTYRNFPMVGKIAYYRFGGGKEYIEKERRSRRTALRTKRFNEAKYAALQRDYASARAIIQRYNNEERPDDDLTIKKLTMKGIRTSIKRDKRKLAETRYEAQRAAEGRDGVG